MTLRSILLVPITLALLSTPGFGAQSTAKQQTRDWSEIDANHDSYVSPDEMQKYLNDTWAHGKTLSKKRQGFSD